MASDIAQYFTIGTDTSQALAATHEPLLVIASYVIAALAGFAFLRFTSRIIDLEGSVIRFAWMIGGALIMGLGVWAMHFVAMLAYRLPIPVAYDALVTAASALPAMLGSAVALYVVARPTVTTQRLLLGGGFLGAGIGAMHYSGMAAMRFDAFLRYDPVLFATSIVVAIALAFVALYVTLRTTKHGGAGPSLKREISGALVMGLAVSGMHYTAMTSAFCLPSSGPRLDLAPFDPHIFAGVTTTVAVLVLLMAIAGVIFDRRLSLEIAQRRRVQSQLQRAQKMEAIGQLTGGIAHDFNNLLGIIIGNLDLLKRISPRDGKPARYIDAALDAALRGTVLNRRMLAFGRRQSLRPERIDLQHIFAGMTVLLERAIGERIVMRILHGSDLWPVAVDVSQLEAAIINLMVNARDAMPDGGTLTVETANTVLDRVYQSKHPDARPGDYVCISVVDTGTGMTPDVLARAFEPFFTTKSMDHGSGLGLSMVFGFVQQSGGYIHIESESGRGTAVRLYLPRADAGAVVIRRSDERKPATPKSGHETILVVEDNNLMGEVVSELLQDLGYAVVAASNADEALRVIDTQSSIDLLFTDVIMPGQMDGIALTQEARRRRPALKALLTSGFAHPSGDRLPVRLLAKPYRTEDLATSIRQALDEQDMP